MRARSISHAGTAVLIAVLAWGGLAVALVSQHVLGMEPCPWCIIQRLAYLLVGIFAILSLFATQTSLWARTPLLLAGLGAVAAATSSCAFTAADKFLMATGLDELLPSVFKATAACDEANAPLLGVPYSLWSAALAVTLLILIVRAFTRAGLRT